MKRHRRKTKVSKMILTVRKLSERESYSDIARVPYEHRIDKEGKRLERGKICRLICNTTHKETYVILRGTYSSKISIDSAIRRHLNVNIDQQYDFELESAGLIGWICWAVNSSDAQYSFAARISFFSLALGIAALLISFLQVACH
jgi:hypothetical protein